MSKISDMWMNQHLSLCIMTFFVRSMSFCLLIHLVNNIGSNPINVAFFCPWLFPNIDFHNFGGDFFSFSFSFSFFFLAVPCSFQDLSSQTRDWTWPRQWKHWILTTRPPGKSPGGDFFFNLIISCMLFMGFFFCLFFYFVAVVVYYAINNAFPFWTLN